VDIYTLQTVEEALVGKVAPFDPYRQQPLTVLDHHTPFDVYCVCHRHSHPRSETVTYVCHRYDIARLSLETDHPNVSSHSVLYRRSICRRDGGSVIRTVCRHSLVDDGRNRLYSNLCRPFHGDGHNLFYDERRNDVSTLRMGLGTDGAIWRMMLPC